jgi:protein ImuA
MKTFAPPLTRARQALQSLRHEPGPDAGPQRTPLGAHPIDDALRGGLARGVLHEILAEEAGDLGAAYGFALALGVRLLRRGKVLWIQEDRAAQEDGIAYAPGIAMQGLDPSRLIMVRVGDPALALWAMEQALRCRGLDAVVTESARLAGVYDLTASRRLGLAAREGGATGLLIQAGIGGRDLKLSSAAFSRWLVGAHRSRPGLAGEPGYPSWRLRLARQRGGREGQWLMEWNHDERVFVEREVREHEAPSGQTLSCDHPPLRPQRAHPAHVAAFGR